jgi:NTE family protein
VKASMGLPGLFTPVRIDERTLLDGGAVDPVPWDILAECDVVIAVDVLGRTEESGDEVPNAVMAVTEVFDIMQRSIVRARMDIMRPDIYLKPDIPGVGLLEFHRAEEIYGFAGNAADELERELTRIGLHK